MGNDCVATVTMPNDCMKQAIRKLSSGLQSCAVGDVIHHTDFNETVDLQITSACDCIVKDWIPDLASIIFGCNKEDFAKHWMSLFQSCSCSKWFELSEEFPEITLDWSDVKWQSFLENLTDFASGKATEADTLSF